MTTPRRRWSFGLRTMLLVVAIVAGPLAWVAWQARIVHVRLELRRLLEAEGCRVIVLPVTIDPSPPPNLVRRIMGDEAVDLLWFEIGPNDPDRQRAERMFPEAQSFGPEAAAKLGVGR